MLTNDRDLTLNCLGFRNIIQNKLLVPNFQKISMFYFRVSLYLGKLPETREGNDFSLRYKDKREKHNTSNTEFWKAGFALRI